MKFENSFILDKEHYTECFEQSRELTPKLKTRYFKVLILLCFGLFFYMVQIEGLSGHLGAFFFILAFVEVLSVKYAKAWWITRQMWSKASNSEINLTISDNGIDIKSDFTESHIEWAEIDRYQITTKGIILFIKSGGTSYISKQSINEQAWQYLLSQLDS